jgi:hypothetical protein
VNERKTRRTVHRSGSTGQRPQPVTVPFGMPRYEIPEIPDDVTIVSDDRLMQIFFRFVAWQNFAATEFAAAEVEEERADRLVRRMEAEYMVLNWGAAKDKVTLARAQQATDPKIDAAKQVQLNAYATRKMRQVVYENCAASAAALSRELTRRLGRDPMERRNMRWNP